MKSSFFSSFILRPDEDTKSCEMMKEFYLYEIELTPLILGKICQNLNNFQNFSKKELPKFQSSEDSSLQKAALASFFKIDQPLTTEDFMIFEQSFIDGDYKELNQKEKENLFYFAMRKFIKLDYHFNFIICGSEESITTSFYLNKLPNIISFFFKNTNRNLGAFSEILCSHLGFLCGKISGLYEQEVPEEDRIQLFEIIICLQKYLSYFIETKTIKSEILSSIF